MIGRQAFHPIDSCPWIVAQPDPAASRNGKDYGFAINVIIRFPHDGFEA
jgi:hypothetical protein